MIVIHKCEFTRIYGELLNVALQSTKNTRKLSQLQALTIFPFDAKILRLVNYTRTKHDKPTWKIPALNQTHDLPAYVFVLACLLTYTLLYVHY